MNCYLSSDCLEQVVLGLRNCDLALNEASLHLNFGQVFRKEEALTN